MQALDLNFATRPFKNNTLLWVGYSAAVLVLVLFSVWNVRSYTRHRTLVADLDREVATIDDQFRDLDRRRLQAEQGIRGYDLDSLAIQAAKADDVIRWKAFSWTRLFNQLEDIQPHDVRMTSIHPIFRTREDGQMMLASEEETGIPVSVGGVAKDHAAFLDLERALLADAHFDRVEPSRTAREKITDHILFDLRFSYDPDATLPEVAVALSEDEPPVAEAEGTIPEPQSHEPPGVDPGGADPEPERVEEAGFDRMGAAEAERRAANDEAPPDEEEAFPPNPPRQKAPTPQVRRPTSRQPPNQNRRTRVGPRLGGN
jgi:hypothetical protein